MKKLKHGEVVEVRGRTYRVEIKKATTAFGDTFFKPILKRIFRRGEGKQ